MRCDRPTCTNPAAVTLNWITASSEHAAHISRLGTDKPTMPEWSTGRFCLPHGRETWKQLRRQRLTVRYRQHS